MRLSVKSGVVMIHVEVVYARPRQHWCVDLELADGTTAEAAANVAVNSEPMLWIDDIEVVAYGVWGREVSASQPLCEGDRLELLRPLPVQPMDTRRRKALQQRRTSRARP